MAKEITLRDHFAGHAIAGLTHANESLWKLDLPSGEPAATVQAEARAKAAKMAWAIADAMEAARDASDEPSIYEKPGNLAL